jgi:flagellar biosynthesis protein FlhB
MASDEESGEKSEQPSERRREQAREQGNFARSVDVNAAAVLMGAAMALWMLGPFCGARLLEMMRSGLSADAWLTTDAETIVVTLQQLAIWVGITVVPLMGISALGALASSLSQTGFAVVPSALEPKFERLDPIQGFQRLFSLASLVRLAGSLLKISCVAVVAWTYLTSHQDEIMQLPHQELSHLLPFVGSAIVELSFYLALTLLGLAVLDYGYQYWQHEQDLRMSLKELKDEYKESEGDPLIRSKRREIQRKMAERKDLRSVPTADVVITNPTELAIAIKYDPLTMPAPTVVAKGAGEIAAQIRRLAAKHGIPIIERKPLARALYRDVKVGQPVPVELYGVFVEILAYVYRITGKKPPTG